MDARKILYPIARAFTANYYIWLVSVWVLGPLVMVLTFALFLMFGAKNLVASAAKEAFVSLAYTRKQWLKKHERYRRC